MSPAADHEPPPGSGTRRHRLFRRNKDGGTTRPPGLDGSAAGEQERLILEALADLRDMDVREVMTPRVDVTALSIPVHGDDIARAVRESGHSCFPVFLDDLDHLVGVLFVNDLFRTGRRAAGEHLPEQLEAPPRLRPPYVLPETLGVLDALTDMRRQRKAFAVVVDEYGGVAGVLTVKDLLEPLVGDLHDEFDADEEPTIVRVDTSRWLVDGRASVDEVRDKLEIDIPDGEYVTLGGFLFDGFGHIPAEGERLEVGAWELRVVEMDKRRVAKVVATRAGPAPRISEGNGSARAPASVRSGHEAENGASARRAGRAGVGAPSSRPQGLE